VRTNRIPPPAALAVSLLTALATGAMTLVVVPTAAAAPAPPVLVVDDFEYASGLPVGTDANGVAIGYSMFNGAGSSIALANPDTPPAPALAELPAPNKVLQLDLDVTSYAGVIRTFENEAMDTWVPQDWSAYEGFTMWLYGQNSGSTLFVDLLENRNPGSVTDDAQRWSVNVTDDFSGWKQLELPFSSFTQKLVGNGAPNDDFERYEMNGWALGALGTGGPRTYYVDNVGVYGVAPIVPLTASFSKINFDVAEGTTGDVTVKLSRPMNEDDPAQVSVGYAIDPGSAVEGREYTPANGTLTFVNGGPRELTFPLETFDDAKYEGDERVVLRLFDPVGLSLGSRPVASGTIKDDEAFDPNQLDDFEGTLDLWHAGDGVQLDNPEIAAGDSNAVPGQGAYERVLEASVPHTVTIDVRGQRCGRPNRLITVTLLSTPTFNATTVDPATVTYGNAHEVHTRRGVPRKHVVDANHDGRKDLVFHFRAGATGSDCHTAVTPFNGMTYDGQPVTNESSDVSIGRDFAAGQDWSGAAGLSFWYLGRNTGEDVVVEVLDNRAPDPGPSGWQLAWSDEFDTAAGTAPDPANWGFEIGDGTANGNPGWGNNELQYYTDSTDNAATDGNGNMVITAREADESLQCYYGPCEYTSARLLSANKAEFTHGRIESRIQVPTGEAGLWPAFWTLGADINRVGWPQCGETDIMEYVSRLPDEVFGTLHGPGYFGGGGLGNTQSIPNVAADYHTFAVEWEPDLINWYVDGILYHTVASTDVAPNEWVFDDPFYLLLNMAVGGNLGGALSDELTFPQEMKIDYVRVYQGPDTAERFEAPFVDDFTGWQQVTIPFSDLARSTDQPVGAPDDGLTLNAIRGYGIRLPADSSTRSIVLDQVRLVDTTPPTVTITDNVEAYVATGDVKFDFAFSEDVGTSFTSDDIVLSGGTKGAFVRVDSRHATLVARPPADTTGTLEISVAAGAFTDLAGNASTSAATAQQAYVTPPPPSGGLVITFDEATPPVLTGFGGAEDSTVVADPADASNLVAQVIKASGAEVWAGTTVSTGDNFSVPVIPFSEGNLTMTARVWSPDAGIPVRLKVENAASSGVSVETEATTTVAGAWETLTFDFANQVAGTTALDLAATYDKASIFFDFGTAGAGKTYYLDDLTFPAPDDGEEPSDSSSDEVMQRS
jgi:beta-glucanase (GH16 family)